ncbi:MAG TPA: hypothetical protein VNU21_03235 [Usitatibacter sp.]|jgi:hypothetical protein|nr:hypothetical protein [Usitatibacter sp.]
MNRLTAIGLASLVAYGLLVASKYTGVVSAAREDRPVAASHNSPSDDLARTEARVPLRAETAPRPVELSSPVPRAEGTRLSPAALEFRAARDLKAFADALMARRESLNADERYHLARALEECQFATTINEDLAAYSAKQRRQFLASLPVGDPLNPKRISAYEAVDNTQRCIGFQNAKISPKDIDDLYRAAAQQGDPRAQARMLTADLNGKLNTASRTPDAPNSRVNGDDMSRMIGLLETRDPEAMLIVGQFLSQSAMASQLHVGPNGEVPEPSALLGGFSLVACDMGQDCSQMNREPLMACAYAGYCNAQSFEELYQNFLASPWAYTQAMRYRGLIHTAIDTRNWGLIGLLPPAPAPASSHAQ